MTHTTIEREKFERMMTLLAVATLHTPALQAERTELVDAGLKALAAQPAPCTWTKSPDPNTPDTFNATCGVIWTFTDGGPTENGMNFCPGCGAAVSVADPEPEEDLYGRAVKADNGGQP